MILLQRSVSCLYGRNQTSLHALPKCHRNVRFSCLSLHSSLHNLLYPPVVSFFGSLGLFFGCDVISFGLILLRFWVCVSMIFRGQAVFHCYYFWGVFLLVVVMLHHTFSLLSFLYLNMTLSCDKWVPVTTAWHIRRLQMEERPPIWRVKLDSDRMSYLVLRGRWCNIIVLNVHAPSEEKSDDSKRQFL